MTSRKSVLLISLLLSACGTSNTNHSERTELPPESVNPPKSQKSLKDSLVIYSLSINPRRTLSVVQGVTQDAGQQVIVNAANEWMAYDGAGGAHQNIVEAAGRELVDAEVKQQKGRFFKAMVGLDDLGGNEFILNPGEAMTTTAGNLQSKGIKYIIHGVGPRFANVVQEKKAGELKSAYAQVFFEMNKLHTQDNTITTLALMPISGGIFSGGDQNVPEIYDILINSTIEAMGHYEWLVPTICVSEKQKFDIMKSRILKSGHFKVSSSALSSSVVASTSKLALLDAPIHTVKVGTLNFQGAATSLGSLRVMGGVVDGMNEKLTQLTVGQLNQSSFMGCEFETSYRAKELAHYSIKFTGIVQVSESLKLASGVGCTCESMAVNLSNNVRNFLNLDSKDYQRHGVIGDMVAQYQSNISSNVSFTTNVGIRALYMGKIVVSPFVQASCKIDGFGIAAVASPQEVGLNFQHHQ